MVGAAMTTAAIEAIEVMEKNFILTEGRRGRKMDE